MAKVFLNNWPIVGLSISQYNVHLHGMQYVTYSCTILLSLRLLSLFIAMKIVALNDLDLEGLKPVASHTPD